MRINTLPAGLAALCLAAALTACGGTATDQPASMETAAADDLNGPPPPPDAVAESAPAPASAKTAAADTIRGRGGLEEKCLKAVADEGTAVIGTNRIEESEAAIEVYVNVEGGAAPWLCRGNRDGTIESVEYTQEG